MEKLQVRILQSNPTLEGLSRLERDVVFSRAGGVELKLQLILPERVEATPPFPVIVFVQGSAWTFPNVDYKLPQMGQFAQAGIAVAMVTHRNALEGHKAPAFLKDVKTAIRFLRANGDAYHLDPERIGIWGTSSGGNAALLVGVTGDDPAYKTGEYAGYSDRVKAVADCFGPADLPTMMAPPAPDTAWGQIFAGLLGTDPQEQLRLSREISPLGRIQEGREYPPFLILHGDRDQVVPYDQSVRMGQRLLECGAEVSLIRVAGAGHEDVLWSREAYGEILAFFKEKL